MLVADQKTRVKGITGHVSRRGFKVNLSAEAAHPGSSARRRRLSTPRRPVPHISDDRGPPVTALSRYRGPCTITRNKTVIDRKLVSCDLRIRASGVVIQRSIVHGTIHGEGRSSFSLIRSTLDVSPNGVRLDTGVGDAHFRVIDSEIRGGNRGINCDNDCVIRRSWVHGQDTDVAGVAHESGIRMGQRTTIVDNTIACDAPDVPPDAGCSAALTGYGDFGPVRSNVISGNYFPPSSGGTCAYGGSSGGKPYSGAAAGIRFVDNVFSRGPSGNCGYWAPIMDFDRSAPGNVWVGNAWLSGASVSP